MLPKMLPLISLIFNDVTGVATFSRLYMFPMLFPLQHQACSFQTSSRYRGQRDFHPLKAAKTSMAALSRPQIPAILLTRQDCSARLANHFNYERFGL
jgi:hypothetical protein